jgi:hypothetical protein
VHRFCCQCASDNRIRITAQHADNGSHVWTECYDRFIDDIFAVQDEITLVLAKDTGEADNLAWARSFSPRSMVLRANPVMLETVATPPHPAARASLATLNRSHTIASSCRANPIHLSLRLSLGSERCLRQILG